MGHYAGEMGYPPEPLTAEEQERAGLIVEPEEFRARAAELLGRDSSMSGRVTE